MSQKLDTLRVINAVGIASIALALSAIAAAAQAYPPEVVAHCARVAPKMPGMGCITCDNFRDYVEHACEANRGRIPGSLSFEGQPFDDGPTEQDWEFSR
jgi:hypothetical protein